MTGDAKALAFAEVGIMSANQAKLTSLDERILVAFAFVCVAIFLLVDCNVGFSIAFRLDMSVQVLFLFEKFLNVVLNHFKTLKKSIYYYEVLRSCWILIDFGEAFYGDFQEM